MLQKSVETFPAPQIMSQSMAAREDLLLKRCGTRPGTTVTAALLERRRRRRSRRSPGGPGAGRQVAGAGAEVADPERCDCSTVMPGMCRGGSRRGRPPPAGRARGDAARRDGAAAAAGGCGPSRASGCPPPRGGRQCCFATNDSFTFLRSPNASELPGGGAPRGGGGGGGDGKGSVKRRQLNDSGCSSYPHSVLNRLLARDPSSIAYRRPWRGERTWSATARRRSPKLSDG